MTKRLLELMKILGIEPSEVSDSIIRSGENTFGFNNNFDKRLRLQKAVFLIEQKSHDFDYQFSLYLRGPYSKELARDYYSITDNSYIDTDGSLSNDAKKMAEVMFGKDNIWLEIASTIVMFSNKQKPESAVERTKEFKTDVLLNSNLDMGYVDSVNREINNLGWL